MGQHNFVQSSGLFSYSGTECLRNAYYHNDCRRCIDICPKGAFHIVRNKLTLFENECIACAACIGGCPTEALEVETFDPNAFTAAFRDAEEKQLSCKKNTPCLGVFDVHHFITMGLRSETPPSCDMAHCEGCALNVEGAVEARIRSAIGAANRFFFETGYDAEVMTVEEKPEANERRMLFRKAFEKVQEGMAESSPGSSMTTQHRQSTSKIPLKQLMLKNALKEKMPELGTTAFASASPVFFAKEISFEACTNCGDCVQFCPTEALFATGDKHGINFNAGNCIGCGICEAICKVDAITTPERHDLVAIAYDRTETLVHYEMVQCHECRCPYPYKGGDPVCDRCKDFKSDFSDMFTLAKDL